MLAVALCGMGALVVGGGIRIDVVDIGERKLNCNMDETIRIYSIIILQFERN